jgi:hypothetical protein
MTWNAARRRWPAFKRSLSRLQEIVRGPDPGKPKGYPPQPEKVALTCGVPGALGGVARRIRTPSLLIRRLRQVVQDCPGAAAFWADIPGLSFRVDS